MIQFIQNYLLITYLLIGVCAITATIYVILTWNKNKKSTGEIIPPPNTYTRYPTIVMTDTLKYYLTDEYFRNMKYVYIQYYKSFSPRRLIGRIENTDIIVLSLIDSPNYKVYIREEIIPTMPNYNVTGYWGNDVFHIISAELPTELNKQPDL